MEGPKFDQPVVKRAVVMVNLWQKGCSFGQLVAKGP